MDTQYTTLIERYFDQLLSPEEELRFEQLKKTDPDFQAEFELFEKSHQALKLATIVHLKEEIKELHDNLPTSSNRPVIYRLGRLSIAASLLCIVGLTWYAQQFSNSNLYENAYTPVGDYITTMDNEFSDIEKAMKLFNDKNFDEATASFQRIFNQTGEQVALFYTGQSLFQANKPEEAITVLNQVTTNYKAEAQWYIALAYLKLDKDIKAQKVLEKIISEQEDDAFVLKATKLKDQLSSPFRVIAF